MVINLRKITRYKNQTAYLSCKTTGWHDHGRSMGIGRKNLPLDTGTLVVYGLKSVNGDSESYIKAVFS